MAGEGPQKRGSRLFITLLKIHEAVLQVEERGKILGLSFLCTKVPNDSGEHRDEKHGSGSS